MTRNLIILGLIALIAATDSKRIEKRHSSLVSRFTSNPFFLRHFGVDAYSDNRVYPRVYFYENAGADDSSEAIEESEEMEQNNRIIPVTEETGSYQRVNIFKNEETEAQNEERGQTVVLFKILPHFEQLTKFRQPSVLKIADRLQENLQSEEKNNLQKVAVTYLFNSLPHFDRLQDFREEEKLFVSKINEDRNEETVALKILPNVEESHFAEKPFRRVVKVIRRKKLLPQPEDVSLGLETGFGRRLTPKKIESIADIPLENSRDVSQKFDSYGNLLSPVS